MSSIPKMRTVGEIKQHFSDCGEVGISERELRRLAKSGKIPAITAGRKLLINLDGLYDYLNSNRLQ